MKDEATLLRNYADDGNQGAFTELVRRHVDLVYGAALRRTGGNAHLAADVAQQVFISLARNAGKLARHTVLSAWLHTATRNFAVNLMLSEQRRQAREYVAVTLEGVCGQSIEPDWEQVRPVLDAAIDELPEAARSTVVLRFLERRPFAEIGAALEISEDAARMRTDRALEKLRVALARRGITSPAAALGTLVAAQTIVAAPLGLANTLALGACAAAGTATAVLPGFLLFMNSKLITATISAVLAFGLGTYLKLDHAGPKPLATPLQETATANPTPVTLQEENRRLQANVSRLSGEVGALNAALAEARTPPAATRAAPAALPPLLIDPRLLAYQQQRGMIAMLSQFASAGQEFRKERGRWPTSIDELVGDGKYIRRVLAMDGEDYSGLQFRDGQKLVATTPDGVTASVDLDTGQPEGVMVSPAMELAKELARQLEPTLKKALEAYRATNQGGEPRTPQALIPFLTTPQERADFADYLEVVKVARAIDRD